MLLSAIPKKMPLSGKERGEIAKIFYLNIQNVAQTLRIYNRNHGLRRGLCTVKVVRDLIHKCEENGCTCYRPRSGRPSVPVVAVTDVHQPHNQFISTFRPASARGVSRVLNLSNPTVRKIMRSVLF